MPQDYEPGKDQAYEEEKNEFQNRHQDQQSRSAPLGGMKRY